MIEIEGGDTKDPLTLYYRDGLDCFKFLLANPLLAEYVDFSPRHEYVGEDKSERLYNEMMTGDRAWTLQVYLFQASNAKCSYSAERVGTS